MAGDILGIGEPTLFRHEADCIFAIRVFYIRRGRMWPIADQLARDIIGEALRNLGAQRPSWLEGQPDAPGLHDQRMFCANPECRRPLKPNGWLTRKYCDHSCKKRAKLARAYQRNRTKNVIYARLARRLARSQGEVRSCEWCGTRFHALDVSGKRPQRFCGGSCASKWSNSLRRQAIAIRPVA